MLSQFKKDKLTVQVFDGRPSLGKAAALMISDKIKELLVTKSYISIIFAAAPSQNETLDALAEDKSIEWNRIIAFHMDEYIGLEEGAPQTFGSFLKGKLFGKVALRSVNYLGGSKSDINAECERYAKLLNDNPPDIVLMGIGENTHLAFNDPHIADFNDPEVVKTVSLDLACRQQQVNDKCFETLNDVPERALTLTIPTLISVPYIYCMVPGKTKAQAILNTLTQPISEEYPSTILRTHDAVVLFIDADSYSAYKTTLS